MSEELKEGESWDDWVQLKRKDIKRINDMIDNVKKSRELINKLDNILANHQRLDLEAIKKVNERIDAVEKGTLQTINMLREKVSTQIKSLKEGTPTKEG